MSKAARPVLLVGGVPGNSAEEVFRTVAPILGDLAIGFTDSFPEVVWGSPEELGAILSGDYDAWKRYRDQIVGESG